MVDIADAFVFLTFRRLLWKFCMNLKNFKMQLLFSELETGVRSGYFLGSR
jgi:hypothetical protein